MTMVMAVLQGRFANRPAGGGCGWDWVCGIGMPLHRIVPKPGPLHAQTTSPNVGATLVVALISVASGSSSITRMDIRSCLSDLDIRGLSSKFVDIIVLSFEFFSGLVFGKRPTDYTTALIASLSPSQHFLSQRFPYKEFY